MQIKQSLNPLKQELDIIYNGLCDYNERYVPNVKEASIAYWLLDETECMVGGVSAQQVGEILQINYFWLPEMYRGKAWGSQLIHQLEDYAIKHELRSMCLDTYNFQAPKFYLGLGFHEVGRFKNYPVKGVDKIFLQKALA